MPLFSRSGGGSGQRPRLTINGHPQPEPELPGSLERRHRLFIECTRLLAGDRLATEAAAGIPIGKGHGLEGLTAKIKPLFDKEKSLIRWVALRGAIAATYVHTVDPASRIVPFYPAVETAMGVGHLSAPDAAEEIIDVAPEWVRRLSREQRTGTVLLFAAIKVMVFDYERYSHMGMDDVNRDPKYALSDSMALAFIAWNAVALLRLGIAQQLVTAPEPDALEEVGWYTDPLWGKAQRFWDGADWTSRCRAPGGMEGLQALRPVSTDRKQPERSSPPASRAPQAGPPDNPLRQARHLDQVLDDAEAGDAASQAYRSGLHAMSQGDVSTALGYYEEAARLGLVDAMYDAGCVSAELGRTSASTFWWEAAARRGHANSAYNLGVAAFQAGDLDVARHWYQTAAELGEGGGCAALTQMAADAGDKQAEMHWSGRGAELGHPFCLMRYGQLLMQANPNDRAVMQRALALEERAAETGEANAMFLAGVVNGQLGHQPEARRWLEQAERAGHPRARNVIDRYGF